MSEAMGGISEERYLEGFRQAHSVSQKPNVAM
jgi:hypothetical protein